MCGVGLSAPPYYIYAKSCFACTFVGQVVLKSIYNTVKKVGLRFHKVVPVLGLFGAFVGVFFVNWLYKLLGIKEKYFYRGVVIFFSICAFFLWRGCLFSLFSLPLRGREGIINN